MKQSPLAKYPVLSLLGVQVLVALVGVFASSGLLQWAMGCFLAGSLAVPFFIPQMRHELEVLLDIGENDDEYVGPPEGNPAHLTSAPPPPEVKKEFSRRRNPVDPANAPRRRKTDQAPSLIVQAAPAAKSEPAGSSATAAA
jgi:hypothetical protein